MISDAEALRAAAKRVPDTGCICWAIHRVRISKKQNIKLREWIRSMLGDRAYVTDWLRSKRYLNVPRSLHDPRAIAYRQAWCEHLAQICEREDRK